MIPCTDGEAAHPITALSHNFKYHVFQSFRFILKDFFVHGLLVGTKLANIVVEGKSSSNLRRTIMEALLNDFGHVFLLELMMACAITLCGCYTTYTDIHFRHIPNRASWGLLAVGLVSQGLFWLWGQVELDRAGLVFLVGFAVSYVLYIYGFWAPGDAKLFWAFVLVLPPTFFPSTSLASFNAPIWALLLNDFVDVRHSIGEHALPNSGG